MTDSGAAFPGPSASGQPWRRPDEGPGIRRGRFPFATAQTGPASTSLVSRPGRRRTASLGPEASVMAAGEGPCLRRSLPCPLPMLLQPLRQAVLPCVRLNRVQWSALPTGRPTAHGGWPCAHCANSRRFHGEEACLPSPVPDLRQVLALSLDR